MSVLISDVVAPLEAQDGEIIERACSAVRIPYAQVVSGAVAKTSVDARRRPVRLVHTVELSLRDPSVERALAAQFPKVRLRQTVDLPLPSGTERLKGRVVIVGFGPAGMFAGLRLARCGYRPLIFERGATVEERVEDVRRFWEKGVLLSDSNVQFGEGGAGTFSDGKLVTRIGDPYCEWALRTFVEFGGPEELLTRQKPHIGTDRLRGVIRNIRAEIERLGGEVRFHAKVDDFRFRNGRLDAVSVQGEWIETGAVVLAIGHSARDTFSVLHASEVQMEAKPFSVGVRIEHLQTDVDRALYGSFAGHPRLPKGEYQLSLRRGEEAVYTFCMCPGGTVVPSASEQGGVVTNGMSEYARDGVNANAALVVSVDSAEYGTGLFDGVRYQQTLEQAAFRQGKGTYSAPCQTAGRFLAGKPGADFGHVFPTYERGVCDGDFRSLFSPRVCSMLELGLRAFEKRQRGFACEDAVLTGVETRTSSPLRILRDDCFVTHDNLYPCGEGAGYAGGITSAAVDGLRCADELMKRFSAAAD